MIEAGLEKLIERYVREFTKDVRSLISQHERIVLETGCGRTVPTKYIPDVFIIYLVSWLSDYPAHVLHSHR